MTEKTGDEVEEGLVKLMDGLLKDKLQESKLELRNIHGPEMSRACELQE